MAAGVQAQHVALIRAAIDAMRTRIHADDNILFVISGNGEFLAHRAIADTGPIVSLHEQLGARISVAAPAHAIVVLAREQRGEKSTQSEPL